VDFNDRSIKKITILAHNYTSRGPHRRGKHKFVKLARCKVSDESWLEVLFLGFLETENVTVAFIYFVSNKRPFLSSVNPLTFQ